MRGELLPITILQPELSREHHAENCATIARLLTDVRDESVIVLPELWWRSDDVVTYLRWLQVNAARTQSVIVGGSLHTTAESWNALPENLRGKNPPATWSGVANLGAVVAPDGTVRAWYGKQHPYGVEVERGVQPALCPGTFEWRGARVGVMICADAWDAKLWRDCFCADVPTYRGADEPIVKTKSVTLRNKHRHVGTSDHRHRTSASGQFPELICITTQSVAGEHARAESRALWNALATARAYEFGCGVAIADWAAAEHPDGNPTAGAAGFVDPASPSAAFVACNDHIQHATLDISAVTAHRTRRVARGFYW